MCVSHHHHPYKCCCCMPLVCGVIFIFFMEIFCLLGAIASMDIFCIVASSVLLCLFVFSFIKHKNFYARNALYWSYLVSLVIFLVYAMYYATT